MPGRTPYDAYHAFIDPLSTALNTVARAVVRCSPGGKSELGRVHELYLGHRPDGDQFIRLRGGVVRLELKARMKYEIVSYLAVPTNVTE